MAVSENQQPVDTTQQVTSPTPTTRPKNPKRVAAGKAVAEKTKLAHEAQKKALAEAQIIIANQKKADPPMAAPVAAPVATPVADPPGESTRNVLTTAQWLSVISIFFSLWEIYIKREEIKKSPFHQKVATYPSHLLMSPLNLSPLNLSISRLKKEVASAPWIELFIRLDNNGAKKI